MAQVFASWRGFLGRNTSLGFIESLGWWDIEGPDGTVFANTDPAHLRNITGWVPRLEDAASLLLQAARKHNPAPPEVPLLDHYQIDFGMGGVEYDTRQYGPASASAGTGTGTGSSADAESAGGGINYGRVLGAERIMHGLGLRR